MSSLIPRIASDQVWLLNTPNKEPVSTLNGYLGRVVTDDDESSLCCCINIDICRSQPHLMFHKAIGYKVRFPTHTRQLPDNTLSLCRPI